MSILVPHHSVFRWLQTEASSFWEARVTVYPPDFLRQANNHRTCEVMEHKRLKLTGENISFSWQSRHRWWSWWWSWPFHWWPHIQGAGRRWPRCRWTCRSCWSLDQWRGCWGRRLQRGERPRQHQDAFIWWCHQAFVMRSNLFMVMFPLPVLNMKGKKHWHGAFSFLYWSC